MEKFLRSAAVVACVALPMALVGCGKIVPSSAVVGTWEWKTRGNTVIMQLDKDGTGTLSGPGGAQAITWKIQYGNNFAFKLQGKELGFLIDSHDANTIRGNDPATPGEPIVWTRK